MEEESIKISSLVEAGNPNNIEAKTLEMANEVEDKCDSVVNKTKDIANE